MESSKRTYAVMGASGNVGGRVARHLLESGAGVRAIGRNAEKVKDLAERGATFHASAFDNSSTLTTAFQGATGAFVMLPPELTAPNVRLFQDKVANAIAEAIRKSGIKKIVALSSIGAQNKQGVGLINGLHDFEVLLNEIKEIDVRILRAGFFMENFYNFIPLIQMMGIVGSPFPANAAIPMAATRDIGQRIANFLFKLDFNAHSVKYILGPKDVTFAEATRILGEAIGKKDLPYKELPPEQVKAGMMQMGISESGADLYLEMAEGFKRGLMKPAEPRTPENSSPTTIEEFAKDFAQQFRKVAITK